jgi:hypothetical protein
MDASIQAVSPELICELRMTDGSVVEGAAGAADAEPGAVGEAAGGAGAAAASGTRADVATGVSVASGGASAQAEGTDIASRAVRNNRDNLLIDYFP